jgi:MoaA/NifB/PqqE/SkfB family radical SAM enzyme
MPNAGSAHSDFAGRTAGALGLDSLREVWFHVTNRCNLSCRHCLFRSSPSEAAALSAERG